ncbi:MAG: Hsp33 family molecular chaperone HslO, partial [Angelakisella sp.]
MVGRAEYLHQTSAVVTAALGRLMTAASIIGAGLKG